MKSSWAGRTPRDEPHGAFSVKEEANRQQAVTAEENTMKTEIRRFFVVVLAASALSLACAAQAMVLDDFESYPLGSFPSPNWLDVGTVLPIPPIPPIPSATIVATTDAHGNSTRALSTVGDLASAKGIYTPVPVSSSYTLGADVRIDRYSDHPDNTTSDWPMQLTFAQSGVSSFADTPQAGIYASSLTQGWRLFLISSNGGPFADIDLAAAADLATWYHLDLTLDAQTGMFHSQITDLSTSTLVSDKINVIGGWDPSYAQFDSFAFFGGELSNDTIGDIGVVDDVNVTTSPVPEPATFWLIGAGLLGLGAARRRARS